MSVYRLKFTVTIVCPRNNKILYLLKRKCQANVYVADHAKEALQHRQWTTLQLSRRYLCLDSAAQIANSLKATRLATDLINTLR